MPRGFTSTLRPGVIICKVLLPFFDLSAPRTLLSLCEKSPLLFE